MGVRPIYDAETQYLTIAFAKAVGLDRQGCVVPFDPREWKRRDLQLAPLLVYSAVAPAYSQQVRMLVDPRKPVAVSRFLALAWSAKTLLGLPLTLQTKATLLSADKGYASWVKALGVDLIQAAAIKRINAFERTSLDVAFSSQWGHQGAPEECRPLDQANAAILAHDMFRAEIGAQRYSLEDHTYRAWLGRPKRFFDGPALDHDWDAAAIEERPIRGPKPDLAAHGEEVMIVPGLEDVADMWPGGRRILLKDLEITARDFDFWLAGRAHLPAAGSARLEALLGITYLPVFDEWQMAGGHLLVATTVKQVKRAYDELSHGGDLRFSFEILGPAGEVPGMRCLVFASCGGFTNIVLFERGSTVEAALSGHCLINLQAPVRAPLGVWDTVTAIIRDWREFETPGEMGIAFEAKHSRWLNENGHKYASVD